MPAVSRDACCFQPGRSCPDDDDFFDVGSSGQVVRLKRSDPLGHYANPMSDDQLTAKFLGQTDGILPDAAAQTLLERLWTLEKQPSATELLSATSDLTPA